MAVSRRKDLFLCVAIAFSLFFFLGVPKVFAATITMEQIQSLYEEAQNGDAEAQNQLGVLYADGNGLEQNDAEAVKWYRKAANQGNLWGQRNFGLMHEEGRGVPQDDKEAVKWYRFAAGGGLPDAYFRLGLMYEHGRGVPKDKGEALKLYVKAAESGHEEAQERIDNWGQSTWAGDGSIVEKFNYYSAHYPVIVWPLLWGIVIFFMQVIFYRATFTFSIAFSVVWALLLSGVFWGVLYLEILAFLPEGNIRFFIVLFFSMVLGYPLGLLSGTIVFTLFPEIIAYRENDREREAAISNYTNTYIFDDDDDDETQAMVEVICPHCYEHVKIIAEGEGVYACPECDGIFSCDDDYETQAMVEVICPHCYEHVKIIAEGEGMYACPECDGVFSCDDDYETEKMIKVECPHCSMDVIIPDEYSTEKYSCPTCSGDFVYDCFSGKVSKPSFFDSLFS